LAAALAFSNSSSAFSNSSSAFSNSSSAFSNFSSAFFTSSFSSLLLSPTANSSPFLHALYVLLHTFIHAFRFALYAALSGPGLIFFPAKGPQSSLQAVLAGIHARARSSRSSTSSATSTSIPFLHTLNSLLHTFKHAFRFALYAALSGPGAIFLPAKGPQSAPHAIFAGIHARASSSLAISISEYIPTSASIFFGRSISS